MDIVLAIVNEGRNRSCKKREITVFHSLTEYQREDHCFNESASARSVSVDRAVQMDLTAILVAGKTGSGEADALRKDITANVNVFYTLKKWKTAGTTLQCVF